MNDDYSFLKNKKPATSRRRFIKGSGSLVALGSLPAYLTANPAALKSTLGELHKHEGMVLYRAGDVHSVAFAHTLVQAGLKAVALNDDMVRQWRDGLEAEIGRTGVPMLGLTNWADYFVISGLAAERRKHVMLEMQHMAEQPDDTNWSASLATGYLQLPVFEGRESIQVLAKSSLLPQHIKPGSNTLFSWLIA